MSTKKDNEAKRIETEALWHSLGNRPRKMRAWHREEKKMYTVEGITFPTTQEEGSVRLQGRNPNEESLDRVVLMSFTGAYVEDRAELWEADVVADESGNKYVCTFANLQYSFSAVSADSFPPSFLLPVNRLDQYQVIGNFHEGYE